MIHKFIKKERAQQSITTSKQYSFGAGLLTLVLVAAGFICSGCATQPANSNAVVNTNASMNSSAAMNTNTTAPAPVSSAAFAAKEPDKYSLTMTITGQGAANNKQGTLPPQAIEFSRLGTDRRWALTLPVVGQVIYLEKPDFRYLIIPSRSQYVEIAPDSLGFKLGNVMTPSAMIEQLKPRIQSENLGTETINGRTAAKYRLTSAADTHTKAGTVQSDSFVYVDEATGLPLRADLNFTSSSGGSANGVLETRDINLNPDTQLFAVPTGYKKMTADELKQQVQGFIQFIRAFAPMLSQQASNDVPPATPPQSVPQSTPATPNANRR